MAALSKWMAPGNPDTQSIGSQAEQVGAGPSKPGQVKASGWHQAIMAYKLISSVVKQEPPAFVE